MALGAVSAFLFFAEASRQVRLGGVLVPDRGLIRVMPAVAGSLLELSVAEGETVRTGQALFTLQVDAPQLDRATEAGLQHSYEARRASLALAAEQAAALQVTRQQALVERLDGVRRELVQIDAQALLQQQRQALAEAALARLQSLGAERFVSQAQIQAKTEDLLGLRADAAAVARQRQALTRELSTLQGEQRELPLQAAQRLGEIERERAEIAEAATRSDGPGAQRQLVVRAPADGVVTALHVAVGEHIALDAALATLTPEGAQLQAHLYAPSSALGFLQTDQPVQMRLQAYPYQKFGLQQGHVLQVAQAPLQGRELAALPMPTRGPAAEPMYRVTVALPAQGVQAMGRVHALLPGMQLEADVTLERRRLVEWLFEPVLGWARRG